ncbi:hypothetical protein GQ600_16252 [Phytophthora cactorum]|nr:hypothetical protein GQ600_16252 [Phytophthora cactorum]
MMNCKPLRHALYLRSIRSLRACVRSSVLLGATEPQLLHQPRPDSAAGVEADAESTFVQRPELGYNAVWLELFRPYVEYNEPVGVDS